MYKDSVRDHNLFIASVFFFSYLIDDVCSVCMVSEKSHSHLQKAQVTLNYDMEN